uniref:Predicted nucleic acid-binding protein, contains PIN domain n=1 Tax=Candidatus Kentrum sp. UNK TaxID=2126344 RepID=A0A451AJ46_9GAMM|nr:MAG: Predicted nucleic acid-binding protein, contains PIN domain [Candidatus Kentron sp. UNK]VFK69385.1 MAG: Predicted nucleic acid-binding protein, contains PIN domain [Candidatus Kentron sp. UNK]
MKVYADTSVFGGVFDEEFTEDSRKFFEELKAGKFDLVVSVLVAEEIASAPRQVRAYFDELSPSAEIAEIGPEVIDLRDAYLAAGIVTRKSMDDAAHVALATISGCAIIVSWNFDISQLRVQLFSCQSEKILPKDSAIGKSAV